MLCLVFTISSFGVTAQQYSGLAANIPSWQEDFRKLKKSPALSKLEEIRARTAPDYFNNLYGAKSRYAKREGNTLRTAADCGNYVCSATPLPVTLISFKGERIDANHAGLTWETSSETNNAGFDIERSLTAAATFEKVGYVDGGGTISKEKSYAFSDLNSNENISYYRLKQLDYDGTFEYSRIIAVNGFKELLSLITVPNPGTQNNTFFQVSGNDSSGEIDLTILNVKGRIIYQNQRFKTKNDKKISLAGFPKLTSGLYVAKIISAGQQSTVSFVISE
ncbi:T9SS type A sorting domain-containing protein [Dyadobacter sp. CY356]|uniref:T9SS type A sorting domain-containing protein n=1 Tax=Dyadobacter sp. CY356 TaxID=2906442 RepID=UPI001F36CBE4|nr:T9SS type A sorting domain-containing protein [Dyadobacter sp. CY356]